MSTVVELVARGMWEAAKKFIDMSEEEAISVTGNDWHQYVPDAEKLVGDAVVAKDLDCRCGNGFDHDDMDRAFNDGRDSAFREARKGQTSEPTLVEFSSHLGLKGNGSWEWSGHAIINLAHVVWATPLPETLPEGTHVKLARESSTIDIRVPYEDFKALWRKAMGLS